MNTHPCFKFLFDLIDVVDNHPFIEKVVLSQLDGTTKLCPDGILLGAQTLTKQSINRLEDNYNTYVAGADHGMNFSIYFHINSDVANYIDLKELQNFIYLYNDGCDDGIIIFDVVTTQHSPNLCQIIIGTF